VPARSGIKAVGRTAWEVLFFAYPVTVDDLVVICCHFSLQRLGPVDCLFEPSSGVSGLETTRETEY
jgi:hypothetical protein